MTVVSGKILQSMYSVMCDIAKVKAARSGHSIADIIHFFIVFNIPFKSKAFIKQKENWAMRPVREPSSSVGRAWVRSNLEVVGSNPTKVKFSLAHRDSQISFKGVITQGDFVCQQYCLLPAPKHYHFLFHGCYVVLILYILIISVLVLQIFNSAVHGYIWSYI